MAPDAVRVFANIMEAWRLEDQDAALLLGDVPLETYLALKANPNQTHLAEESLIRISHTIGIYRALHTLHGKQLADRWVALPNTGSLFQGSTPIAYMLSLGLEAMHAVRRKLEADCEAHYL
jgi:hypothetical protein